MNAERRERAARVELAVIYAVIGAATAAFWAGVWFGIGQPLLDAWLNR